MASAIRRDRCDRRAGRGHVGPGLASWGGGSGFDRARSIHRAHRRVQRLPHTGLHRYGWKRSRERPGSSGTHWGWSGDWGTTYPANLRLYMQRVTEDEWVRTAQRAAATAHAVVHPARSERSGSARVLSLRCAISARQVRRRRRTCRPNRQPRNPRFNFRVPLRRLRSQEARPRKI